MNTVQAGRLLTLAYYLKTEVPPDKFDMDIWGMKEISASMPSTNDLSKGIGCLLGSSNKPTPIKTEVTCKTSACALGWATVVFPERFRMSFEDNYKTVGEAIQDSIISDGATEYLEGLVEVKRGSNWYNWTEEDLNNFFGISEEEVGELFHGHNCTPKEKAKQIEALVSKHGYTYK